MDYEDLVEWAKLGDTIVDGGYIKTTLLDVDTIIATGDIIVVGSNISGLTNDSGFTDDSTVDTLITSLGDVAYEDLVEFSKLGTTVISGAYLKTSLIDADDIFAENVFTESLTFSGYLGGIYFGGGTSVYLQYLNLGLGAAVKLNAATNNNMIIYSGSWGVDINANETNAKIITSSAGYTAINSSDYIELDAADHIFIDPGTSKSVYFQQAGTTRARMYMSGSMIFNPTTTKTGSLGDSSHQWGLVATEDIYIDGWNITVYGTTNDLEFRYGSTEKVFFNQSAGNLVIDGELYENYSFTIDTEIHEKWELFDSIHTALKAHNADLLDNILKHRYYRHDEYGETGEYSEHIKWKEMVQVLTECLFEVYERLEVIENAT